MFKLGPRQWRILRYVLFVVRWMRCFSIVFTRDVLPAKYVLILEKDEFYNLVLINHVHRHVARLDLRPQQGRAEHDSHALSRHPVHFAVIYHPENRENKTTIT